MTGNERGEKVDKGSRLIKKANCEAKIGISEPAGCGFELEGGKAEDERTAQSAHILDHEN